jgi:hypothetical protein
MKYLAIVVVLFAAFISTSYSQDFRITPNNNQYYFVKYYQEKDSISLGKFVLLFTVTERYVSTFLNPKFSWSDGSGTLESKLIAPGKYQIDLPITYKKENTNCITVSELSMPRIIDVEISDLNRHLIKIEYLSNLTHENIYTRISRFNPLEAKYDDLIIFVYNFNNILRKYDPYCELILPEVVTGDFSTKITDAIRSSWEKTRIKTFYSLCNELSKAIRNDTAQNIDPELLPSLSQANSIQLSYYNAYRVNYMIDLLENSLALPAKHSADADKLILKSLKALKEEKPDSTDRFLVVANVVKSGFQRIGLLVAYSPTAFQNLDDQKMKKGYLNFPSSPSFGLFPESEYTLWAEDKKKGKVSNVKLLNTKDSRYKEIVFPINETLAIVRVPDNFGKNLNFDRQDFYKELDRLMIQDKCLFLANVSIPLN